MQRHHPFGCRCQHLGGGDLLQMVPRSAWAQQRSAVHVEPVARVLASEKWAGPHLPDLLESPNRGMGFRAHAWVVLDLPASHGVWSMEHHSIPVDILHHWATNNSRRPCTRPCHSWWAVWKEMWRHSLLLLACQVQPRLPLENGWNEAPLCYPASSDRNGSEIGLKIAAFFILFEPFGDIVSVLTILRIGQPFPAAFMAFRIALACTVSGDPLQLSGAHAVAESLRKGFETRALMHYKDHELWESWICATVQVYSLMFLHPKTAKLSTGLNLLVSASVNLAISIPAQKQATYVIGELKDSDWTFATIQEAKRSPALRCQKVVTTLGIVLTASMAILFQKVRPGGDLNMEPFWFGQLWPILCDPETWQQWLLALVVICFRVPCDCLLLICYIFGIFGCPWHAIAISVAMMLGATFGATYRIDRFPSDGRSNSQTDGLPLLDAESPLISSRFSCLNCEDSQSSEESSEE